MKSLVESLFDNDLVKRDILYHPRTKDELIDYIEEQLEIQGPDANLNIIDVSKITDMHNMFYIFRNKIKNIDISEWNMSNVKTASSMFEGCKKFNSDLSKWNMRNVKYTDCMFYKCESFNSDLSKWDVSKVTNMSGMFADCKQFNSDLSKWNVSNVKNMNCMFDGCKSFNSDLSKWGISKVESMYDMFDRCVSLKKIPSWYHENS